MYDNLISCYHSDDKIRLSNSKLIEKEVWNLLNTRNARFHFPNVGETLNMHMINIYIYIYGLINLVICIIL